MSWTNAQYVKNKKKGLISVQKLALQNVFFVQSFFYSVYYSWTICENAAKLSHYVENKKHNFTPVQKLVLQKVFFVKNIFDWKISLKKSFPSITCDLHVRMIPNFQRC